MISALWLACAKLPADTADTDVPADTDPTGGTGLGGSPTAETGTSPADGYPTEDFSIHACSDATYTYDGLRDSLSVEVTGPGAVRVALHGRTHGCGCQGSLLAVPDEALREIAVWVDAGDCDGISCCNSTADVTEIPAGDWTFVRPRFDDPLATPVTVP